MFGFTCPALCMVCMVSGVCFRDWMVGILGDSECVTNTHNGVW